MNNADASSDPSSEDPGGGSGIVISISGVDDAVADGLTQAARVALTSHGILHGNVDIAVVDDAAMREQHLQWLGDDSSTDSLAFDLRELPVKDMVDAQMIVCETVARDRADIAGHDWRDELTLYVVHGCLHVCGFDDHDPGDAERMHAEEDRILVELGRPAVFSRGEAKRAGGA